MSSRIAWPSSASAPLRRALVRRLLVALFISSSIAVLCFPAIGEPAAAAESVWQEARSSWRASGDYDLRQVRIGSRIPATLVKGRLELDVQVGVSDPATHLEPTTVRTISAGLGLNGPSVSLPLDWTPVSTERTRVRLSLDTSTLPDGPNSLSLQVVADALDRTSMTSLLTSINTDNGNSFQPNRQPPSGPAAETAVLSHVDGSLDLVRTALPEPLPPTVLPIWMPDWSVTVTTSPEDDGPATLPSFFLSVDPGVRLADTGNVQVNEWVPSEESFSLPILLEPGPHRVFARATSYAHETPLASTLAFDLQVEEHPGSQKVALFGSQSTHCPGQWEWLPGRCGPVSPENGTSPAKPDAERTWHVASGGTGSGADADPFGSIQQALDAARPGDTVIVGPGTYAESVTTVRDGSESAPIRIRSADGRNSVTVTEAGRVLTIAHSYHVIAGLVLDGQYGPADTVAVLDGAQSLHLFNSEVRRSGRDCIDMDGPEGVVIERSLIHHCILDTGEDAHGIAAGAVTDLAVRDTEIHTFTGDGIQVDPGRNAPGWNNVIIEGVNIWLEPLDNAENGLPPGTVVGENAVDTKSHTDFPRAALRIHDTTARGFSGGRINNQAAFNLKENIDASVDGVTVSDSAVAFRLRHPAKVTVQNSVVHDVEIAVRYEDGLEDFQFLNNTLGAGVTRSFVAANSSASVLDIRNLLTLGQLPSGADHPSNMAVDAKSFQNIQINNYHLTERSAAIDQGVTLSQVTTDRDGRFRPQGAGQDPGAYEYSPGNAYFEQLAARPDVVVARSFRQGDELPRTWNFDPSMDAALGIVPAGDGTSDASIYPQLRVPTAIDDGVAFYTWDAYLGPEFEDEPPRRLRGERPWSNGHKAFQIATSRDPNRPDRQQIWFEPRMAYGGRTINYRGYGNDHPNGLGPGTSIGPGGRLEPHLDDFPLKYGVWTRWFVRITHGDPFYTIDAWVADEQTGAMQILRGVTQDGGPRLNSWWAEFDSSLPRPPRSGPLRVWVRNLIILHNPGDVASLLVQP